VKPECSQTDNDPEANSREFPMIAINKSKNDVIIAEHIEWAGTGTGRRRGLLGRESLDCMGGVYLVPCEWIHTFGMRFPIDVAFLSPAGRILAVHHNLRSNRLSKIVLRAEGVLELSAGRLRATNTDVGDYVQFIEPNDVS